ncbi:MAG TPA: hypothetical protein VM943_03475 [Pyrinomonadaceae bacterium]|nr:hypothetical protein [Pyrinomonadaceae bacterium]
MADDSAIVRRFKDIFGQADSFVGRSGHERDYIRPATRFGASAPILPALQKTIRRPLPGVMYLLNRSGITIYVDTQASPKA